VIHDSKIEVLWIRAETEADHDQVCSGEDEEEEQEAVVGSKVKVRATYVYKGKGIISCKKYALKGDACVPLHCTCVKNVFIASGVK
jgi:hypothetical protein